jgi:iron complex transport system ATP-binding protein
MSSASEPKILELRAVSFSYSRQRSLMTELSFSVGEGEFIGLLGANGSGKSTILKLGSGILRPSGGEILLWSRPLHSFRNRDRAKLISYLPQTLDITVPFTIRELVAMGLYPYDIPPAMSVDSALDMVGLQGKASAHLADLSGGEKRRTFIAMTLVQGAGLLMLDEPLANLDIKYQIELVRLLKTLRDEKNISIIMALHDINLALQFSKVMLVKDGSLLGIGKPEDVLTDARLRDAFDVQVSIMQQADGSAYIRYGNGA